MSRVKRIRESIHYETDVARCATCMHFRNHAPYVSRSGAPGMSPLRCGKHAILIRPNAVCDDWTGKDGTTLDPVTP